MPKDRNLFPAIFTLAVFIILEIASLRLVSSNGSLQRIWLARQGHFFQGKVWGGAQGIAQYFSLKKQNAALVEENHKLTVALGDRKAALAVAGADSLASLLGSQSSFRYIPASIVKISRNRQHNYLIIDKGSEDGIHLQDGIVTPAGIIGIVDAVDKHYSYAISFMNPEISISARLGSEGAVGPLTWDGVSTRGAVLKEIPLQYKFQKGDTVFTSGFSAIFPPDIPIGTTGDAKIVNGATNEIKVNLFQDFSTLKYVVVVENIGREEIMSLEAVAKGE